MSERYPLSWPEGWKRIDRQKRVLGRFSTGERRTDSTGQSWRHMQPITVFEAVKRIQDELDKLGVCADGAIISTNIPTRLDGLPRSGSKEPDDPGAAVYWVLKNRKECMAIDRYTTVADNLAAIAATLEALRAIERHGGAEILDRAFRGFVALPEVASGKSWRKILQLENIGSPSEEYIRDKFKELARVRHPDAGGTNEKFHELIWARDQALLEVNS